MFQHLHCELSSGIGPRTSRGVPTACDLLRGHIISRRRWACKQEPAGSNHHNQQTTVSVLRLLLEVLNIHLEDFPREQKSSGHHVYSPAALSFPSSAATQKHILAFILGQHRPRVFSLDERSCARHTWVPKSAANQCQNPRCHHHRHC